MTTYDLSHPIRDGMPVYPGDPSVTSQPHATVPEDGYSVSSLGIDTHTGTHVDAPAHMLADGRTIDDFDPETFQFVARIVDRSSLESRTRIDPAALAGVLDPETTADVDLLVLRTGWDEHWGSDRYFDHPYITAEAAETIVDRDCHVAVDAPNVDPTPTENAGPDEPDGYPAHRTLFAADRLIVENLRGLGQLPTDEPIDVRAYPLRVADGDGAPVRAIAHA